MSHNEDQRPEARDSGPPLSWPPDSRDRAPSLDSPVPVRRTGLNAFAYAAGLVFSVLFLCAMSLGALYLCLLATKGIIGIFAW